MAATVDSSSTSPQSPSTTDSNSNSPNFPGKKLVSPWSHIVRGADSDSTSAVPQSSKSPSQSPVPSPQAQTAYDSSGMATAPFSSEQQPEDTATDDNGSEGKNSNVGLPKKQAWKKPQNGIVEPVVEMDILSWPLLSEINKAPAKVLANSSNGVADGSFSTSKGSVPSNSYSHQKQGRISGKALSGTNHTGSNHHRFVKGGSGNRNMGVSAPVQSISPHPPLPPSPPPFPVLQLPPTNNGPVVPLGGSHWDTRLARDFAFRSHGSIDHQSSSRRGTFRPQPYGDASNKDGANYPNSKDGLHQSNVSPMGLVRPPPPFAPPPMGPFVRPMGFPDYYYFPTSPLEPFRGMPFFTHGPPPAMFFPIADSPQTSMLIKQIDYYFSDANLAGDDFLKSNMDKQGWVPISLIASFPRVKSITSNVQLILNSLRSSAVVEVNDDRVRRRNDWVKWIPTSVRHDPDLETSFPDITIDKNTREGGSDHGLEPSQGNGSTESQVEFQLPNGHATEKID